MVYNEKINSIGEMAFVGKILEKIGFCKNSEQSTPRHPHVLKSIIGLFTQGRTHFEEMDIVREDSFFKESLDLTYVPAKETTRLYLEHMIPEQAVVDAAIETATIRLLQSARLTPMPDGPVSDCGEKIPGLLVSGKSIVSAAIYNFFCIACCLQDRIPMR